MLSSAWVGFFGWFRCSFILSKYLWLAISVLWILDKACQTRSYTHIITNQNKKIYEIKKPSEANTVQVKATKKHNRARTERSRKRGGWRKKCTHAKSLDRTRTVHNEAGFCNTRYRTLYNTIFRSIVFVLDFKGSNSDFFPLVSWYCQTVLFFLSINSDVNVYTFSLCWYIRYYWSNGWYS